jgi:heme-degrading monooxygenase HmoA
MFARVSAFEIDTMRISLAAAEKLFADEVVPAMRDQQGFAGFVVMRTPEGKGLVVTLWDSEETAAASVESGHYGEQIARFIAFMKQPPGRDHYEVVLAEMPAHTAAAV